MVDEMLGRERCRRDICSITTPLQFDGHGMQVIRVIRVMRVIHDIVGSLLKRRPSRFLGEYKKKFII